MNDDVAHSTRKDGFTDLLETATSRREGVPHMTPQHESRDERAVEWLRCALGLHNGETPFPWQIDLLHRFFRGESVSALDIPTGLGKTATMAVWLVARALGASVSRKLVYVVDRRAVVDQATEVAESLRRWVGRERVV